jgi:hypothetical protein
MNDFAESLGMLRLTFIDRAIDIVVAADNRLPTPASQFTPLSASWPEARSAAKADPLTRRPTPQVRDVSGVRPAGAALRPFGLPNRWVRDHRPARLNGPPW